MGAEEEEEEARRRRAKKEEEEERSSETRKKKQYKIYTTSNTSHDMERSYHPESSGSRPITEDKLGWARLVLR